MLSCVIPCYDMNGCGVQMLRELIASIRMQTFADVEIVISSHGLNIDALYIGEAFSESRQFLIKRVDGKPGAAANLNNAIDHARGEIIKPMFQDDKFMEPDTLQKIADAFEPVYTYDPPDAQSPTTTMIAQWIACTSHNEGEGYETWDHVPYAHSTIANLREGENTYGSPSAMAWRRNELRFDENLKWLLDCEFYGRMAERYGAPAFVDTPIFIRQWDGQATRVVATGSQRIADLNYVVEKYR